MVERQRRLLEVYAHLHDHCGVHTQKDLAHILRYSRVYISSALNGNEKNLTDKLFKSICEAFPETFNLNYLLTGEPTEQRNMSREIAVPASCLGTTGELTMSIFGLSAADEWTTSIDITATDASGVTIGKASIAAAPFKRNRSTDYSGPLFGTSGETSVLLNNEWSEPYVGEW